MIGERTTQGWEIRLRIRERGRFFSAAFLGAWLCGWAAGEAFALWILGKGAIALLTGTPPDPGREPLQIGPAVLVGAFLLVWLSIWTLGGVSAIGELLRLLWGVDRIVIESGRLTVRWMRGPLRSSRTFERDAIRRISLSAPHDFLVLETGAQRVELSRLGTRADRQDAAATLNTTLSLAAAASAGGDVLPEPWEQVVTPEGERALVPNLATRRQQARFTSVITMLGAAVTFLVARGVPDRPELAVPAAVALALTAALAGGALWLARGRNEWRIGSGSLTLRRRYGANVRDLFEARRLVLDSSSDSDGDHWFELYAVGPPPPAPAPAPAPAWRPTRPPNSRPIARLMNQPEVVRDLAAWLTRHGGVPLEDRTTPEARAADVAQLRAALEHSGRFGQWAAKLVDRLGGPKRTG